MNAQGFNEGQAYSAQDVRYVEKNGVVYATIMAWPEAGNFTFKAFSIAEPSYSGEVDKVELLGAGAVEFTHGVNGLTVVVPGNKPNSIAPVFKITFKEETRSAYELLQDLVGGVQTAADEAAPQVHAYNTGKYSPAK